jgi:hypothetical protein
VVARSLSLGSVESPRRPASLVVFKADVRKGVGEGSKTIHLLISCLYMHSKAVNQGLQLLDNNGFVF